MYVKKILSGAAVTVLSGIFAVLPLAQAGAAPSTVIVTPSHTHGWTTDDTRPGGAVNFINDATSPLPSGALQLTTNDTNAAKAQYTHAVNNLPISQVTNLAYDTKQVSGTAPADPSYQLAVDVNGAAGGGFTNFVFEPYWNGTVTPNAWQHWDVNSAANLWSSSTVSDSSAPACSFVSGAGGPPFYSLAQIKVACPNAVVVKYGVNVGSYNPSYNVETDAFVFNDTTYNFELDTYPTTRDDCKNGGYATFTGEDFKNQGQCVRYVNNHSHKVKGDIGYTAYSTVPRHASFNMDTASNHGFFHYVDNQPKVKGQPQVHNKYTVAISSVKVSGNTAWFAGEVTSGSDPSYVGQWLFAKVVDGGPDQIWGSFTTKTAAEAGVASMTNPADGAFNVLSGNLKVN